MDSSLSSILKNIDTSGDAHLFRVGEDWTQGRTIFGGVVAALASASMRLKVDKSRQLRSMQIAFVGPNSPGEVVFESEVLREGKSATIVRCTVKSKGVITASISGVYGAPRESMLALPIDVSRNAIAPEELTDWPFLEIAPNFMRKYAYRQARGPFPYTGATESDTSIYLRYTTESAEQLAEPHVIALMDAIPPPSFALLSQVTSASTVSMSLEMLDSDLSFSFGDWWRYDAAVDAAGSGYTVHSGHLINPNGKVTAMIRQTGAVFG